MSIFLGSTETITVVLDAAPTNQLPCSASYVDQGGLGGDNSINTNGVTPVVLVAAPAAGTERLVSNISIPNADTATRIVTVSKGSFRLCKITLLPGYQLFYDGRWMVLDPSGNFLSNVTVTGGTLTANQGTAAAINAPWPVELSNGTVAIGTASAPLRIDPTGTTLQPVNLTQVAGTALGVPVAYGSTPTGDAISVNAFVTNMSGGGGGASNITEWNTVALGSPTAYGTAPGAVNVIGVNANVTNTVTVNDTTGNLAQASTTAGQLGTLAQGAASTAAPAYATGKTNPLSLTLSGALRIDGSGVTQPVSGTVAVTQSTSPWTIQGDSASGAANAGNPVKSGAVFNTTQPTVTTGQTVDAQSTARGALIVSTGLDLFNVVSNISQYGGVAVSLGQKVSASSQPVVIASDQSSVGVTDISTAQNMFTMGISSIIPFTFGSSATKFINSIAINYNALTTSGTIALTIKDGGGTARYTFIVNALVGAIGTSTTAFGVVNITGLAIPLTNAGSLPSVALSVAPLTGGIYVQVGYT